MVASLSAPSAGWPSVTYETLPWQSRYEPGEAPRREMRRRRGDYQAAVTPRIAAANPVLSADVSTAAEDAAAEIARFDAELGGSVAPFASILLRSESAASSQIENLTASARAIAEAELDPGGRGNAAKIVANTRAMQAAVDLAEHLDANAILQMHHALMVPHDEEIAGKWRAEQVWIRGGNLGPHEAMFVPPHHTRLEGAIEDLVAFMDRDDLPVLTHAAIAHAQFETLHPFPDGNGRTGRALIHSLLKAGGLTRSVTVPVSAGLLADVDVYFEALTSYRNGDPGPIVQQLTSAAYAAMRNGRQLAEELREVRKGWQTTVKARRGTNTWRIADLLLRQPVINASLVAEELGIHPNNVYRPLAPLVDVGVLREATDRRRNRIWRCDQVLVALDDFAARAGRRQRPDHS